VAAAAGSLVLAVVVAAGCDDDEAAPVDVDEAVTAVAALESTTIGFLDEVQAVEDAFFAARDGADDQAVAGLAEAWRQGLDTASARFADDATAQIDALGDLPLDADADAARQAAVEHYRVWVEFTDRYPAAVDEWLAGDPRADDFEEATTGALADLGERIDATFEAMCDGLGTATVDAPDAAARVAEICG
jgi:hypothetical protein